MEDAAEHDTDDAEQTGEIVTLTTDECWDLVSATTVGRLGFRDAEDDVQIIPVNYQLDGEVIIRTSRTGILAGLPGGPRVAFQIDHHGGGAGWSVLMHGRLIILGEDEAEALHHPARVLPWAGGERDLLVRFSADDISGRRVRRIRNRTPRTAP